MSASGPSGPLVLKKWPETCLLFLAYRRRYNRFGENEKFITQANMCVFKGQKFHLSARNFE